LVFQNQFPRGPSALGLKGRVVQMFANVIFFKGANIIKNMANAAYYYTKPNFSL
jgi:hypothetical protein